MLQYQDWEVQTLDEITLLKDVALLVARETLKAENESLGE